MQREIAEEKIEKPAAIPSTPAKKKAIPIALIILLAVVCIGAVLLIFLSMKTEAVTGTVVQVGWERSIAIEGIVPVDYRDWQDSIPADGEILRCEQEVRSIENEPKPNAEEVCGTPYSVDTGSGYAEVVQDCQYYIYDDFCTYTVLEWAVVDTVSQTGDNFSAVWPEPVISADQRLGVQTESYLVYFDTENGEVRYNISDFQTFQEFQPGTQWNLEINSFGGIVSVSP